MSLRQPNQNDSLRREKNFRGLVIAIVSGMLATVALSLVVLAPATCAFAQSNKRSETAKSKPRASDALEGPTGKTTKNKRVAPIEGVATYTSRNFVVNTDLPANEAQELLKRLETMVGHLAKYWGRPLSGTIEMYVVKDIRHWPPGSLAPEGLASVERGGGVTVTQTMTLGSAFRAKSTVYATADRGTPQHEAVHAFCGQTFGRTGPLWYSEGMAEVGQYWRADDSSVNAHEVVIDYLRSTEIKSLHEIVNGQEWSGDSWQNYAWRWALCHLLGNNPNYAARFRPLGLGFLTKQDVSFEQTYGDMAKEISFEYREFIRHLERNYRVELCAWDWKAKFKPVKTSAVTTFKIDAGKGWQPSRLTVSKGEEYEFSASGTWTTVKGGAAVSAQGAEDGSGRLLGIVLRDENGDYKLDEPFELGAFGEFTAPADGDLYLRCQDKWADLADNKGSQTVKLKLKGKGNPLTPPKDEGEKKSGSDKFKTESKEAKSEKPEK